MQEKCLKVFVSGLCSHKDNRDAGKMHVCAEPYPHPSYDNHLHKCACGKEWCDISRTHVCPVLTDKQYADVAFTKAVE